MAVPSSIMPIFSRSICSAEPVVVEGQRRERVGAAGKDDEADAVVGALVDEGLDDGLDGLQAVDALRRRVRSPRRSIEPERSMASIRS